MFYIKREFNFLTAHGEALSIIARRPDISNSDLVSAMGTTRSKVHRVMADLAADRYASKNKNGSQATYRITTRILLDDEKRRELELCNYLESPLKKKN